MKTIIAFAAIALALVSTGFMTTSTIRAQGNATASQTQAQQVPFLPTSVFQDDKQIVTIVTKQGEAPKGPIVVVPNPEGGKNGTIITPGENKTAENGNVTIIQPNGNVTEVHGGNVTVVDNNTVVVAPPDRNVTVTPGNVTIIDPPTQPVKNETGSNGNNNQTCSCQNQNQSGSGSAIPPVRVIPAPGQTVETQPANNNGSGNTTNVTPNVSPNNGPGNQTNNNNNTTNTTPPLVPNNGGNGTNPAKNGTAGTTNLTVPTSLFPTISKVAINSNNKIIGN
jgi:hypothetical protein